MARDLAITEAYVTSRCARKKSRCCSRTSNGYSDSTGCAYEVQTAPETSSSSPPPQNLRKMAKLIPLAPQAAPA